MAKSLLRMMQERAAKRQLQQMLLHPNRSHKGVVDLPEMPPPPVFAEPAGPEKGLPLALAGLVNRPFLQTERYRQQQTRAVRDGAHPKVLKFTDAFIRRAKRVGIPLFPLCIIRSAEDQALMVKNGVSRDSPDDGVWPHKGCAVDIIHSIKGYEMNTEEWRMLGHLGREISDQNGLGMEWGGDWDADWDATPPRRGWDPAHWQFRKWKTVIGEYPWQTM